MPNRVQPAGVRRHARTEPMPRQDEKSFHRQVVELARYQIGRCGKIEARSCPGGAGNTPGRDTRRSSLDAGSAYHAPQGGARLLPSVRGVVQAEAGRSFQGQGAVLLPRLLRRRAARGGAAPGRRAVLGEGRQERPYSGASRRSGAVLALDGPRRAYNWLRAVHGWAQDLECPPLGVLAVCGRDSEGVRPGSSLPCSALRELGAPGSRATSGERTQGRSPFGGDLGHWAVRSWA